VVVAASAVLPVKPRTDAQRHGLILLVHWGYGSAVGIGYDVLRRRGASQTVAASAFYAGCQSMAFVLFPTLSKTPPPWRWRRDMLPSSLAQHAVYVLVVAVASRLFERLPGAREAMAPATSQARRVN
jgi:uncharacterized membrane protein YagU involved in acid resistance